MISFCIILYHLILDQTSMSGHHRLEQLQRHRPSARAGAGENAGVRWAGVRAASSLVSAVFMDIFGV